MEISERLIKAVKGFESLRLKAYKDSGGVWTIGYGHTQGVKEGDCCTAEKAEAWLLEELGVFGKEVDKLGVCTKQCQFDALTDFAYNCGMGHLLRSTLLRKIKAGSPDGEIEKEFLRWIYCARKPLKGLAKRRFWEAAMWQGVNLSEAECLELADSLWRERRWAS